MEVDLSDHNFYKKSRKQQNSFLLRIGLAALGFNLIFLFISIITGCYLLVLFIFAITLSIIAPFFDTPSLVRNGKLVYYSSLFLAEKEKDGIINIHGGTLFDYHFVIDKSLSGGQRTNFIVQKFLEGMLNLTNSYRSKDLNKVRVKGTSYILNERTLKKAGFTVIKTDIIQYVILLWNYINLTISLSIAKAELTFPNLVNVVTFEADLSTILKKKEFLQTLNERLKG